MQTNLWPLWPTIIWHEVTTVPAIRYSVSHWSLENEKEDCYRVEPRATIFLMCVPPSLHPPVILVFSCGLLSVNKASPPTCPAPPANPLRNPRTVPILSCRYVFLSFSFSPSGYRSLHPSVHSFIHSFRLSSTMYQQSIGYFHFQGYFFLGGVISHLQFSVWLSFLYHTNQSFIHSSIHPFFHSFIHPFIIH